MVCTGAMFMESCEGMILWKPSAADSRHGTLRSTATALTCHSCTIEWRTSWPMAPKVLSREGSSFRHFPSDKCDQHQQPAEMELVSLILCFTTVFLELVDEVAHPVHLHPLHALPCEVHHEPGDLRGVVLSDELASYKLASKAHCAILDRGYLVASLSLLNFVVCLLYALCQGAI
jgi:hypothetical protein